MRYETDVQRLVAQVERDGTLIEIAYDEGAIDAQGWTLPISEVEFELVSGDMSALFDLAQDWLSGHGLILEIRSKAQRGDRLASLEAAPATGQGILPPALFDARRARRLSLPSNASAPERYIACVGECLVQIIANASLLAGVDTRDVSDVDRATQLHQLRVGTRRLRACWNRYPALAPAIKPPIAQALGRKHPEQLKGTVAGPEFQMMVLALLKHLVQLSDSERLQSSA